MFLQYSFLLAFYGTITCQQLRTQRHASNDKDIGHVNHGVQLKHTRNKMPPFHISVIHSPQRAYFSNGGLIEPVEDTVDMKRLYKNQGQKTIIPNKKKWERILKHKQLYAQWKKDVARALRASTSTSNRVRPRQMKIPRNINGKPFRYNEWQHNPGYNVNTNSWQTIHRNHHPSDSSDTPNRQNDRQFSNSLTGTQIQLMIRHVLAPKLITYCPSIMSHKYHLCISNFRRI